LQPLLLLRLRRPSLQGSRLLLGPPSQSQQFGNLGRRGQSAECLDLGLDLKHTELLVVTLHQLLLLR
jgi:hypothetical protein